ncbi:hypothetical protein AKJ37_06570 [candidate division MSBL1 archaeon SCGC-AAA259I09]|uniref:Uncharacterized protein n=3 Tax=candidate division MSBL1 TaxID=215777 RepID=A0A133UQ98_9EURY|nr:hypothetical protein AKJ66_04480 [candidate division MSBL1 archaeon SCGC-AAA259E22]KXA95784.1 hypothetical protein AKJ37_06570 [candidate division MSBL1 archaeon SCGC-AAA259I09]KXA96329.1 hypothetical protein AKJ38_03455 [candidate division MSBL1 archaeon SCGC-AAA259I14]
MEEEHHVRVTATVFRPDLFGRPLLPFSFTNNPEEVVPVDKTRSGASIWYCPVWDCPVTAGETEQIVLHLERHCKPDEVIHRELQSFREAALNGGIACNKAPDDPEHPKK